MRSDGVGINASSEKSRILFNELYYDENGASFTILCIHRPLDDRYVSQLNDFEFTRQKIQDSSGPMYFFDSNLTLSGSNI